MRYVTHPETFLFNTRGAIGQSLLVLHIYHKLLDRHKSWIRSGIVSLFTTYSAHAQFQGRAHAAFSDRWEILKFH